MSRITLLHGNCLEVLPTLAAESVDSCVCDPPYHLASIVQRFGSPTAAPAKGGVYARSSAGFMGQTWDGGDIAFRPEVWAEVLRVLKPGGHLLAFSGTRTQHRMVCAIEDAGFEIRDRIRFECSAETKYGALWASMNNEQRGALLELLNDATGGSELAWEFGSGFPKSHDVSKGIDKAAGAEREAVGVATNGVCSPGYEAKDRGDIKPAGQFAASYQLTVPATDSAKQWAGWGTALKPAHEPICVARKPLSEPTVAANVLRWRCGGINIDGCMVGFASNADEAESKRKNQHATHGNGRRQNAVFSEDTRDRADHNPPARWPANLAHDGSPEVLEAFARFGERPTRANARGERHGAVYGDGAGPSGPNTMRGHTDTGTAARFFFCGKATKAERGEGNNHPTVKPLALLQWLCRLVTPPGGTVLDPFLGSGSTAIAAAREQFACIGIELSADYLAIARARLTADAPLFSEVA